MLIFVYHNNTSTKAKLEEIVDNHENVKFISVSDIIRNNYVDSRNQVVVIVGQVVGSNYGRHPRKGNYIKLHLTDVEEKDEAIKIEVYMYRKAVIRENIRSGDLVGLSRTILAPFSSPGRDVGNSKQCAYEVIFDEKKIRKNPSIWVLTKSPSLHSYDYTFLSDVQENERHMVFGVIVSKEPMAETRGKSYVCYLKLKDKSIDHEFKLNIFLNDKNELPEVNYGDIIQCYIKGGKSGFHPCGTVFAPSQCAIWSSNSCGLLVPTTTAITYAMTDAEEKIVKELREWVSEKHFHLLFASPGRTIKPEELSLSLISAINKSEYFDFQCQVVEVFSIPNNCVVLRVWDGTKPKRNNFVLRSLPESHQVSKKHKLITDYLVDVHVYGEHRELASKLKPDNIILMRNVRCSANKTSATGEVLELKLQLHEGNRFGRTIVVCNPGQCVELKRRLDNVLANCVEISTQLTFDEDNQGIFNEVNFDMENPGRTPTHLTYGASTSSSPPSHASYEIHTQDLSPELQHKVLESRAIEKGLCVSLFLQDQLQAEREILQSGNENYGDSVSDDDQNEEVACDQTNDEQVLELDRNQENEINSSPKQRKGRWFILVLNKSKKQISLDKNNSDDDIEVNDVYPYKRNNPVIDRVVLVENSDESDDSVVSSNSTTSRLTTEIPLYEGGRLIALSTLKTVADSTSLGSTHRIRVKVRQIDPYPSESIINLLCFECPICQYSVPCDDETKDLVCSQCYELKPVQSNMQCIYRIKFLVEDRTGKFAIFLTGSNADLFFGTSASQVLEFEQCRNDVKEMLKCICSDLNESTDVINCKNSWLDLIVETVKTPLGNRHYVVKTKCRFNLSSEKPAKKTNSHKRLRTNC